MKIVDLRITSVNVPFKATLRWACGVETGTTRGIIEVVTEDCIVGLGETHGGAGMEHAIETARPFVIGLDAAGKSLGPPVYRLLAGKTRDRIEFGAYVFYRYRDPKTGSTVLRPHLSRVVHAAPNLI